MIRFLHISDLHLGWQPQFLGAKSKARAMERDAVLSKIVDLALAPLHAIDGVLIVGDLFEHYRPEATLLEETIGQLRRLVKGGKLLVTVPGNHDEISYRDSVYRQEFSRWPGVLVSDPLPTHIFSQDLRGLAVHFYSVAYTAGLTKCDVPLANLPRLELPGLHIGLFHGSLDCPAKERSLPLSSAELTAARYDYVALGHFHQNSKHRLGQGVASYCGAVEAKGFDDLGVASLQLVEIGKGFVETRAIPMPVRPHRLIELNLDDLGDEAELQRRLEAIKAPEAVVRLTLSGTPSCAVKKEQVVVYVEKLFYFCEVVDKMDALSASYLAELSRELSVRGYFTKNLLAKADCAALATDKAEIMDALRLGLRALQGGKSNA